MSKTPVTKDVIRTLRRIAKHGIAIMHGQPTSMGRPIWLGFDDADIQWFLHDHQKVRGGHMLNELRSEYRAFLSDSSPSSLYLWPFTKTQARALLKEIGAAR